MGGPLECTLKICDFGLANWVQSSRRAAEAAILKTGVADEEDEVAGEMEMVDDEEVLEETLRRVTRRLNRMVESKKSTARKARMVESVTDRIMARILKSE